MVLARAWRRRLYASLGLSVILPAALLCSLALLALNAGFPGLSALGQAFSGPSVTTVHAPVLGLPAAARSVSAGTAGLGTAAHGLLAGAPGRRTVTGSAGGGRTAPGVHSQPGSGGLGVGSGGGGSQTGTGVGGGPGGPPPQPHHHSPQPGSSPGPVIRTVTSITSKLPPPVGPAVTGVVNSAGATVSKILHHPPAPSGTSSIVHKAGSVVQKAGSTVKRLLPRATLPLG